MIGELLTPTLLNIEDTLLDFEARNLGRPGYSSEGFRAAIKIAMSAILDKMWELQEKENIDFHTRCEMATKCGEEIRRLVKTFTNIDTFELYK